MAAEHRVGPLLGAAELAEILRHDLCTSAEQAALARHIEAQADTIRTQNREMERLNGEVERLAAGNEQLVAEVRRLLFLYECPGGGADIERHSSIGIDECPRIAALLTPAAGPEGTHHEE